MTHWFFCDVPGFLLFWMAEQFFEKKFQDPMLIINWKGCTNIKQFLRPPFFLCLSNGTFKKNAPLLQNKCHWQLLICYILYHVICHNLPIFFSNNKFDDSRELSLLNGKQQQQQYLPNLRQRSFHYRIKKVLFLCPLYLLVLKGFIFSLTPTSCVTRRLFTMVDATISKCMAMAA